MLHLLEDRIPWFGRYNGYEQLARYLPAGSPKRVICVNQGRLARLRGKLVSLRRGFGSAPQGLVDAVARYGNALARQSAAVGHVLYGEPVLHFLPALPATALARSIFTFHQPASRWPTEQRQLLAQVPHRLFLWRSGANAFEPHPHGSQDVILHGVDTDFFCPGQEPPTRRVLYSGVHLRNLPMLERVIDQLLQQDPDVQVDMLVPLAHRNQDVFARLSRRDRLCWHAGLDEHGLLALYRSASAMLLPLADSGANTAVVEALACGLPLVTTDVGGIRDYGGGSVYPLVDPDDVVTATQQLIRLLDDNQHRATFARRAREFALAHLAWPHIVAQHLALYQRLARSS